MLLVSGGWDGVPEGLAASQGGVDAELAQADRQLAPL